MGEVSTMYKSARATFLPEFQPWNCIDSDKRYLPFFAHPALPGHPASSPFD